MSIQNNITSDTLRPATNDDADLAQMSIFGRQAALLASKLKQSAYNGSDTTDKNGTNNVSTTNSSGDIESAIPHDLTNDPSQLVTKKKGSFSGVFVPTCENMWGVLMFLRFYYIVGQAGVGESLLIVTISFLCALCTTVCLSAIASSGDIVSEGGPYYMISRALGPYVGGSIGLTYWAGIVFLAVLESIGAVEALLMAVPSLDFSGVNQVIGSIIVASLATTVYVGINFVTKLGIVFVVIVVSTILMFYIGLFAAPSGEVDPRITGLSSTTLSNNWGPQYDSGVSFGNVLAVFFPCFTGILSGADRSDILSNPPKNIKVGTFGAICFSYVMYISFMLLWGSVAESSYLKGEYYISSESAPLRRLSGDGGGPNAGNIVGEIAWPNDYAAYIGIIICSLSQALQCLIVAPRILQGIASDRLIPWLKYIAPLNKKNEPARALLVSYILAALLVLIGSLDAIAPLLTMCFLVCYTFLNISCLILTLLRSPTWRPSGIFNFRWRLYYGLVAFLGVCLCIGIMFTVSLYWSIAVIILALALYFYIDWVGAETEWGSGVDGVRFNIAISALLGLSGQRQHRKINWRPQVLVLYKVSKDEVEDENDRSHQLLRFYSHLRKGKGMCVITAVIEGHGEKEHKRAAQLNSEISKILETEQISGFTNVVVARRWEECASYAVQLTGLGELKPNTVLLSWPNNWRRDPPSSTTSFINLIATALAEDKSVLCLKHPDVLSTVSPDEDCYSDTIDVWWFIHDGGLLVLLAWLLSQHKEYRNSSLRIFLVMENVTQSVAERAAESVRKMLVSKNLLCHASVEVILLDDNVIEPYTFDWTIRVKSRMNATNRNRTSSGIPNELDELFDENTLATIEEADEEYEDEYNSCPEISLNNQPIGKTKNSDTKYLSNEQITNLCGGTVISSVLHPSKISRSTTPQFDQNLNLPQAQSDPTLTLTSSKLLRSLHERCQKRREELLDDKFSHERLSIAPNPQGDLQTKYESNLDNLFVTKRATPPPHPTHVNSPPNPVMKSSYQSNALVSTGMINSNAAPAFSKLNLILKSRSSKSKLVLVNLPSIWGLSDEDCRSYLAYCDTMTNGIDRVVFVLSNGREIFKIY